MQEEKNEVIAQEKEAMVPDVVSAVKDMMPPKGISPAEIDRAESAAGVIASNILNDPESRSTVMEATRLGENIQSQANGTFKLMRTSLGQVMDRMAKGDSNNIPTDLIRLRDVMDEMNPYSAIEQLKKSQTAGWFSRVLGRAPGIGKILRKIAMKYESVQTQVDAIIGSLEAGADKLLENSLEIEERYKILKQLQGQLKVRGYQLQVILSKLEQAKPGITGQAEQMAIQKASARLLRRLQNLKVTENAFSQFFITMNTTMDNHENLRDAVMSMTTLTRPVLENGLALKIAQQEERQIAEALSASQDYLGNLMVNVAEDAMDNAALTAKVVNSPLIRLQDLTKSYQILMNRMDEASQIEGKMMESAKQNIVQLEQMTADLEERATAQESAREAVRNV